MDATTRLTAIEEIKQLKARYFLGVDTQDWDLFRREIFVEDTSFQLSEFREEPYRGMEEVLGMFREGLAGKYSVHHGHMPIIGIASDITATGLWAMEDRIYLADSGAAQGTLVLHGFGHYRETYVRMDAGWRIESIRLTRLRLETRTVAVP
ncbi:MAG: nuclear transport factor 2 family protein [Novosphingobium sp.]|nr:nuclear transport factor 2 family protein [Novosphingobium sp.]MCP5402267.1 nuclear transport factor 2 family protein [Novosphingobium sp.]